MKALSSDFKDSSPEKSIDKIVNTENMFKLVSGFLALGFQLGVFFGAACLLLYCWRIKNFPSGVTLGESFSLLTIFIGFSALLFGSIICLVSLGLKLSPLWKIVAKITFFILNKKVKSTIQYQDTDRTVWLLTIPVFAWIYRIHENPINILWLLILSWCAAAFWSIIMEDLHQTTERDTLFKCLVAAIVLFHLIFITGIHIQFFDGAFGALGLRQEKVELYIQSPYSIKIAESGIDHKEIAESNGLIKINDARVLLKNIGEKVIVDLPSGNNMLRFEIPKQYVL
jgi:hypothetical protein